MKEKLFKDNCNVCFPPFFKLHEEALWNTLGMTQNDNSVWNQRHSWFVSPPYSPPRLCLLNATVCMEHCAGSALWPHSPDLLEAAPDWTEHSPEALEREIKLFWKKGVRVCPGDGGMAHETSLVWRGCDTCAPLGLRWGYISGPRKGPAAPLLLAQTEMAAESPHPAGLKNPRKGVQELSPNQVTIYFPRQPRSTHLPSSLVALPAPLGVTTCSPTCITALGFWVSPDLHTWAAARQSTALLGNFLSLCGLREPWNGMEAPQRGGRQMRVVNNSHKEVPLALIVYP